MRLVLHIGLPKTGSTSIQENFAQHSRILKDHGVLFPLLKGTFLHPFHLRRVLLSSDLQSVRRADQENTTVFATLREIEQAVAARPEVLFLSSEDLSLFPQKFDQLRATADTLAPDQSVFAYFRDPVSYYRSLVQHHVKSQSTFPALGTWRDGFLTIIERGKAAFGDRFTPIATNKRGLRNGSIVEDALAQCGSDLPDKVSIDRVSSNTSSSSAVSATLQAFMLQHQSDRKHYGKRNTQLRHRLESYAHQNGLNGTSRLKDGVRETVLAQCRADLLVLRDAHGIVFDAVDYDGLAACHVTDAFLDSRRIEDLFDVDAPTVRELKAVANDFLKPYDVAIE